MEINLMGIINLGTQKIECSDEAVCDKINGYIAALEEENLKHQMGRADSFSSIRTDAHSDISRNIDGSFVYNDPVIRQYCDEVDRAWEWINK